MALRIPVLNSALELNTSSREGWEKLFQPEELACSVTPAVVRIVE